MVIHPYLDDFPIVIFFLKYLGASDCLPSCGLIFLHERHAYLPRVHYCRPKSEGKMLVGGYFKKFLELGEVRLG